MPRILLVGVGAVTLSLVIGVLAARWYLRTKGSRQPEPTVLEEVSSPGAGVRQRRLTNGRVYYDLTGRFTSPLRAVDRTVEGDFVIDADPARTPVRVVFTATSGQYQLGLFSGSFEGEVEMTQVPLDEFVSRVPSGEQTRLYLIPRVEAGKQTSLSLDRILVGDWSPTKNLTLYPDFVGLVR